VRGVCRAGRAGDRLELEVGAALERAAGIAPRAARALSCGPVTRRKPSNAQNNAAELLPDPGAVDKLTAFFDSLGSDAAAAVSLYAVDPSNRLRRSFLLTIPDAAELTGAELMAQVLERYGAGEYFAESRDEQSGQVVFAQRFEVGSIAKRGAVIPPAPATPAAKPGDISAELVAMMARQTAALEALAAQRQPQSMLGMLKELKELRDVIAPPPAAPAFDLGKLLELVNGVATLRDTLGDGGEGGGPLAMIARSLAPALQKIAERAVEAPALPAPGQPPAAGVTDSPPAPPAEGGDVAANGTMLKVYVAELVRFAEQGLDPAAATQRVLQTLAGFPEPMIEAVLDWLNDEAAVDNLAALDPKAAQYRPWLEQVIDGVLDAALEPADTPPASPPANGGAHPAAGG
jgi:hypothetical protein